MQYPFGQIPKSNSTAASKIADAAKQVEQLLEKHYEEDENSSNYPDNKEPWTGNDSSSVEEQVSEVNDYLPTAEELENEEGIYEGSAKGVVEEGIEYIAFYKSFRDVHKPPAINRWGIFFIKRRCQALARDMQYSTGQSFLSSLEALSAFLYAHELFHFRFDAHCIQMEATGGFPVFRPYRKFVSNLPISDWHEESVANYYGLVAVESNKNFTYPKSLTDYLNNLVLNSPGAYSGGINKNQSHRRDQMTDQALQSLKSRSTQSLYDLLFSTVRLGTSMSITRESKLGSLMKLENCPVYWIDWIRQGKSVLVPNTVSIREANNDFVQRYLNGVFDHHSDHSYYKIDNGEKIKIPNPHRSNLTDTEFHNIISKAGMTSQLFYKDRQRTSIWKKKVPRNPVLPARIKPS